MKLRIFSHHFEVTNMDRMELSAIYEFCRTLTEYEWKKDVNGMMSKTVIKSFYSCTSNKQEFRFHITQYQEFVGLMRLRGIDGYETEFVPLPTPFPVNLKMKDHLVDRDYQTDILNFAKNEAFDTISGAKIVTIAAQTGVGKSHISMRFAEQLGERVLYTMRAEYCDKWVMDFKNNYELEDDDVIVVRGAEAFDRMIQMAREGELKAKIILMSNTTLRNFFKDYELMNGDGMYDVHPQDLTSVLGIGVVVLDEAHLDFHHVYKLSCYIHVKYLILMSATIVPTNKFLKQMYFHVFPLQSRYNRLEYKKYIEVKAYKYRLENAKHVKYRYRGSNKYSQNAYEEWIMANPRRLNNYLEMIASILDEDFIKVYQPGMSYVVFSSKVEMTNIIYQFFKKRYPQMKNYRYIGGDVYAEFLKADLVSTSLRKAGAAVDKPNLVGSLMTDAIDSQQTNEQALGRTRPLKDFPDITPRFSYLVCLDVPQCIRYHLNKKTFFADKVKLHRELYTRDLI